MTTSKIVGFAKASARRIAAALAFAAASAAASFAKECPEKIDWSHARKVAPGVEYTSLNLDEPRLMACHLVRVDLKTPGLRVTGTGRAPEWGRPMPDYDKAQMPIDTVRQTTRDFLEEHRRNGTNMVFAVNTAAWRPWEKPHSHKYGHFLNFLVSNGKIVSETQERCEMLVVFTNNEAKITADLPDGLVPSVSVAHPAYDAGQILRDGEAPNFSLSKGFTPSIAPRTALGLSSDGRWLYALVVDGRQKGYSLGAEARDLSRILKAAGAFNAINVDGGGSSTIVLWDGAKRESFIPNRHNARRDKYRPVAANLGVYFEN